MTMFMFSLWKGVGGFEKVEKHLFGYTGKIGRLTGLVHFEGSNMPQ